MRGKIFNSENRFNRFLSHIFDLIVLNLLWMVSSMPIITYGASSIALYTMTLRIVRNEEGALVQGFFKAFRGNLRQSVPVTLIFFFLYSLSVFNLLRLVTGSDQPGAVPVGANIAVIVMLKAVWVWIVPLIARYENSLSVHFGNAWRLALTHFSYTLTFLVTTTAPLFWAVFATESFLYVFPLWLLLGGAGAAAINSIYLRRVFDKLEEF